MATSRNGEIALILTPDLRPGESAGTLAQVPVAGVAWREILDGVFLADWSPDGSQLVVVRGAPSGQAVEYPIGNRIYETLGFIAWPRVSPRGDWIALVDAPLSGDWASSVVVIDTRGEKKTLLPGRWVFNGLEWSPDASEGWFSAYQAGTSSNSLYAVDMRARDGGLRSCQAGTPF